MKNPNVICGKYRLLYRIGEGAMGVVWAAINLHTGREVAVKLITSAADQEQLRHRLLREARAIGQLSHRNVVEVLDAGVSEDGEPYLVMPLLVGETLRQLLDRRRRLEPPLAAQIGRDIARALSAAHAAGIVHRDLKPANIFLHRERGTDGVVLKVVDFGICKRLEGDDTTLTEPDKVLGTVPYMSPEQFQPNSGIDHRTDNWSLGVVLFELLTGVKPFQGEQMDIIVSIISRDSAIPLVTQVVHFVPRGLAEIVARCMVRDREKRIASAAEVAAMLAAYALPGDAIRVYGNPIQRIPASSAGAGAVGRQSPMPTPRSPVLSSEGANLIAADAESYVDSAELPTVLIKETAVPAPAQDSARTAPLRASPPPLSTPPLLAQSRTEAKRENAPRREPFISSAFIDKLLESVSEIAMPVPAARADEVPVDIARGSVSTTDFELPGITAASPESSEGRPPTKEDKSWFARAERALQSWFQFRRPRPGVIAAALGILVAGVSLGVGCRMTPPESAMVAAVPYSVYMPMNVARLMQLKMPREVAAPPEPAPEANSVRPPAAMPQRRQQAPAAPPGPSATPKSFNDYRDELFPEHSHANPGLPSQPKGKSTPGSGPRGGGGSVKVKSCKLIPSACKIGR
ncbi:MAG: serine/threonine protein kinase [Polyangiaceae bacterium]|nr:serine/threonine protein kinase [Polyangiaceae bacterium]